MLARGNEGGRATVRNSRLDRHFRAVTYELATSSELALYARLSGRIHSTKHLFHKNPMGAIMPTLVHRIPKLYS